ncbi:MAG: hypothetical protein DLM60_22475 [Pseudonocardiales bacterium]|nr:MAG: hypothetical protein DLM60_22475 [Pseudonocardiales bacterium]
MSEKDVCERFGVTRYAARAALNKLQLAGLIVTVPGQGRRVAGAPSTSNAGRH